MPWPPLLLIAALCTVSAALWVRLLAQHRAQMKQAVAGEPTSPAIPPEAARARQVPAAAIILIGLWIIHHLITDVVAAVDPQPVPPFDADETYRLLRQNCLVFGIGVGLGWLALTRGSLAAARSFGLSAAQFLRQARDGLLTVMLAWLPVFAVLFATLPFRTPERMHPVLQLLSLRPTLDTYVWAILAAVVLAPLFEELVFRVILQSWLTSHIGLWSIPTSSVVFAAVHGFPDSLAIIPLALVLGTAYHLRRSYWTIVIAHGVFNAVMLGLDAALPDR